MPWSPYKINAPYIEMQIRTNRDVKKKANYVTGAGKVPTRSQGQPATEAVAGSPSISSPDPDPHTTDLFDRTEWVYSSEQEG